jgi:hypothetical protein
LANSRIGFPDVIRSVRAWIARIVVVHEGRL